jgi:hypothetical protein
MTFEYASCNIAKKRQIPSLPDTTSLASSTLNASNTSTKRFAREKEIKDWNRTKKIALVEQSNPT